MSSSVPAVREKKDEQTILDILSPYDPLDYSKGTYLLLRISGLRPEQIYKVIGGEPNFSLWFTDIHFARVYDALPELRGVFGRDARNIRAAILDALMVETGIDLCTNHLNGLEIPKAAWTFLTKMAGLRMPVCFPQPSASPGQTKLMEIMAPIFAADNAEVVLEEKTQSVTIKRGDSG